MALDPTKNKNNNNNNKMQTLIIEELSIVVFIFCGV